MSVCRAIHLQAKKAEGGDLTLFDALQAPTGKEKASFSRREAFDDYIKEVTKSVKLLEGKHGEHVNCSSRPGGQGPDLLPPPRGRQAAPRAGESIWRPRAKNLFGTDAYLTRPNGAAMPADVPGLVRALTSLLPLYATNADVVRSVGYRLFDAKQPVLRRAPLRTAPAAAGRMIRTPIATWPGPTKMPACTVWPRSSTRSSWPATGTTSMPVLKEVAQEEYAHMMRDAIRRKAVSNKLIDVFGERLEGFDARSCRPICA